MKNKTKKRLGVVAAMLGLVVAIGAVAGNTLAKYISSVKVESQTATVAQWGYTVTANASDLFSDKYVGNKIAASNAGSLDVKATAKVVAPGTSSAEDKEGAEGALVVTINGKAEVDAQLVIDIKEFNTVWLKAMSLSYVEKNAEGENETKTTDFAAYYPLKWTITAGGTTNTADLTFTKTTKTDLAAELASQIKTNLGYDGVLPAGAKVNATQSTGSKVVIDLPVEAETPVVFNNYKLTIAWKWEFETGHDVEDTVLGWLAYRDADVKNAGFAGGTTVSGTTTDGTLTADSHFYDVNITAMKANTDYNLQASLGFNVTIVQVQGLTK